MGGSSSSTNTSTSTINETKDGRVAGDNGAVGVSAEGDVDLQIVPGEAFQLGEAAVLAAFDLADETLQGAWAMGQTSTDALRLALSDTQFRNQSEAGQIGEQLIKVGVPAAAIAFAVYAIWGRR